MMDEISYSIGRPPCATSSTSAATTLSTVVGSGDLDELLFLICLAAVDNVAAGEHASLTSADHHGRRETRAATNAQAAEADALQYALNEGPCIDVVQGRWLTRTTDLAADVRWPHYRPSATKLGIASQMTIALSDEPGMIIALNLYSAKTGAFDDDAAEDLMIFAIQAAHTLGRLMS
jgi:hypothetical protein